jgi:LppP/LprE lipoprotein
MTVMKRNLLAALAALSLGAGAGAALGGCGSSGTDTVSVAGAPPVSQTTATATRPRTASSTTPTAAAPTQTATDGGAQAPSTTRTAPEPAFAQGEAHAEGVSEAAAVLRSRGYTPNETSQYHPDQTLRVLVGTRTGSSGGYDQQAFFFLDGRYIGTDTKQPSATVRVVYQSDTEVALGYELYRHNDPLSSPSGGQAIVRFQLNNGRLTPLGTIPPASSTSGLARN